MLHFHVTFQWLDDVTAESSDYVANTYLPKFTFLYVNSFGAITKAVKIPKLKVKDIYDLTEYRKQKVNPLSSNINA